MSMLRVRKLILLFLMILILSIQGVYAEGEVSSDSDTAATVTENTENVVEEITTAAEATGVEAGSLEDDTELEEESEPEVVYALGTPVVKVSKYNDVNRITWAKVAGATAYKVYRSASASGEYILLGSPTGTTLDDKKANSGAVYYYKVQACNDAGDISDYSTTVRFKTIYRVFIACGHGTTTKGKWDPGCVYKKRQEAKLMLPITKYFVSYMRKSGVYVYTDADGGNKLNCDKCIELANTKLISAYISVHCDWKKAPKGTMPLYRTAADKKLAQALNTGVRKSLKIKTRGLRKRTNLKELNKTHAVSCTFETGSIKKDYKFLKKYKIYGKGLAKGLCSYLGVTFKG